MPRTREFSARIIAVLALAAIAIALVPIGRFALVREKKSVAFCELCAAQQIEISWAVRGTGLTLFRSQTAAATPMSELLASKRLVEAHRHQWMQPKAVPNPLDEFGPPVVESLAFVSAPRVVSFMRDLAQYGDATSVATWRMQLLEPRYSYVIDGALRFLLVPPDGFGNRDDFLAWWSSNGFALQNRLRELTEPD